MNNAGVTIAVVGSVNVDIVARVHEFPRPGETVTNAVVNRYPGGKGGNQAMAARRLGAKVYMLACVGDDPQAEQSIADLNSVGVHTANCRALDDISTGLALITVAASGENQIVVAPGANAAFKPEYLNLPPCDAVIAQLEVPIDTVLKAATTSDAFFCLNAAPAKPVPKEVLEHVDLLVVNEVEAEALGDVLANFQGLLAKSLGASGAEMSKNGKVIARSAPPEVDVLDTPGAGDAFTAALTVGLVSGLEPQAALDQACLVGALTVTKPGAQSSPTLAELTAFGNLD
jgi:ribokinase